MFYKMRNNSLCEVEFYLPEKANLVEKALALASAFYVYSEIVRFAHGEILTSSK